MSKSLTTLITNAQALLLDDGTRFTVPTMTAAVRAALKEINQRAPINAAELTDAISDQLEYEVTDPLAISIGDILLWDAQGDKHKPLDYDDYSEDERLYFRLRSAQPSGKFLVVRYTIPHTVNGLDSQTESTIPAFYDDTLLDGTCFYACQIRSIGRIETINLNQGVSENLLDAKIYFRQAFDIGLSLMSRKKPAVSEADTRTWDDEWHNRYQ